MKGFWNVRISFFNLFVTWFHNIEKICILYGPKSLLLCLQCVNASIDTMFSWIVYNNLCVVLAPIRWITCHLH